MHQHSGNKQNIEEYKNKTENNSMNNNTDKDTPVNDQENINYDKEKSIDTNNNNINIDTNNINNINTDNDNINNDIDRNKCLLKYKELINYLACKSDPLVYMLKHSKDIIYFYSEDIYINALTNYKYFTPKDYATITQIVEGVEDNILWMVPNGMDNSKDKENNNDRRDMYCKEVEELRRLSGHFKNNDINEINKIDNNNINDNDASEIDNNNDNNTNDSDTNTVNDTNDIDVNNDITNIHNISSNINNTRIDANALNKPSGILKIFIDILICYISYKPKKVIDILIYLSKSVNADIFKLIEKQFNSRKDFLIDIYLIKIRILKEEDKNIEMKKCICDNKYKKIDSIEDKVINNDRNVQIIEQLSKCKITVEEAIDKVDKNNINKDIIDDSILNTNHTTRKPLFKSFTDILIYNKYCIHCYFQSHHNMFISMIKEIDNENTVYFIVDKLTLYLKYFNNIEVLRYFVSIGERTYEKRFLCAKNIHKIIEGIEYNDNKNDDGNNMSKSNDNNNEISNQISNNDTNNIITNKNTYKNIEYGNKVKDIVLSYLKDANSSISHTAYESLINYKYIPIEIYKYYIDSSYNRSILFYKILQQYNNINNNTTDIDTVKYNIYVLVNIIKIMNNESYVNMIENIDGIMHILLFDGIEDTKDINFNMLKYKDNNISSTAINDIDHCKPFSDNDSDNRDNKDKDSIVDEGILDDKESVVDNNKTINNNNILNDNHINSNVNNNNNNHINSKDTIIDINSNVNNKIINNRIYSFEDIKKICNTKNVYDDYKLYNDNNFILSIFRCFIMRCSIMDDKLRMLLVSKIYSIYNYLERIDQLDNNKCNSNKDNRLDDSKYNDSRLNDNSDNNNNTNNSNNNNNNNKDKKDYKLGNNFIHKIFTNLTVDMKNWRYKKDLIYLFKKYSINHLKYICDLLKDDKVFYIRELVREIINNQ